MLVRVELSEPVKDHLLFVSPVVTGDGAAGLDGNGGNPVVDDIQADDVLGFLERRVGGILVAEAEIDAQVVRDVVPDKRERKPAAA